MAFLSSPLKCNYMHDGRHCAVETLARVIRSFQCEHVNGSSLRICNVFRHQLHRNQSGCTVFDDR